MRHACLVAVLIAAGCTAEEPAWEEGRIGEIYDGLTVGGAGGCSTFIVDGLSKQLIEEQNCIRPNALVSFAGKPGISIGSNVYPYLEPKAAADLEAAAKSLGLDVTSAFRTLAQQYLLYQWYQSGTCGISLAAVPGNSNHETGTAVDLSNYGAAISDMQSNGWTHSYPSSDPVHFDYTAGGTVDLRGESVLAFQKLWNLNNPNDKIAEDGSYGPMTASKVAQSPATGFALGTTCAPSTTPNPPPPPSSPPPTAPKLQAMLTAKSPLPTTLSAGQSAQVWFEFKNTGTTTWTPAATHLGTNDPHDRDSVLAGSDWISPNRPAAVDQDTKPGATGRFTFTVHAPSESAATALTEQFELVEEGVAWFGASGDVTLDLDITPAAGNPDVPDPGTSGHGSGSGPTGTSGTQSSGCSVGGDAPASAAAPLALLLFCALLLRRRTAR
jgi:MYXO-CTERM domain-containing protein